MSRERDATPPGEGGRPRRPTRTSNPFLPDPEETVAPSTAPPRRSKPRSTNSFLPGPDDSNPSLSRPAAPPPKAPTPAPGRTRPGVPPTVDPFSPTVLMSPPPPPPVPPRPSAPPRVPAVDHFSPTVVMASPLPVAPAPPAPPHVSPTATLSRQRVPVVARTQPTRPPEELLDLSFPSRTEALPVPLPRPDPGAPRKAGLRSNVEWYGPYLLLRRVAVGGMAELFMAKQGGVSGFEKVVAIKRLFPHLVRDHELVEMFVHEAKLVAGLNHPNIVQIYSLGRIGDSYHIAMEYVHGRDLRAIRMRAVERGLRLPLDIVVLIGRTVAGALAYAHHRVDERGRPLHIVHRDVSPQNILVSYEGDVKLTDFGIARAATRTTTTMHGTLRGKLAYMSPEQAMGEPEPRSDVFSLGVVLYELLSGQRPLQGDSQVAILEAIQRCRIQPLRELNPRVPERLEQVIMKALSRDPDQRYQDASNLRRALDHCLGERQPASAKELARLMDVLFDGSEQGLPGGPPESDESGAPELEVDFEQTPAGLLVGLRGQTPIPRSGETVEELLERIRPTRRR